MKKSDRGMLNANVDDSIMEAIVYNSEKMENIMAIIDDISKTDATVLLTGETGVGKEVLARLIHKKSHRRNNRFVVINCAAIPENLIESELFGHEKGAFTGASYKKIGKFEQAQGGTVFLDEIGELPLNMQVKLLRVLQERQLERIGSNNIIDLDVRVIVATNRNLYEELQKGNFREDLYYRINVINIEIPPLRERKEDIIPLAISFLEEFSKYYNKNLRKIDLETMQILINYPWRGNIRELKNVMERSVVLAKRHQEILTKEYLPVEIRGECELPELRDKTEITLKEYEKILIAYTLNNVGGNKSKAADILGIERKTLYNKLKEYGIHI
mgnify:FL=1